MKLFISYRSLDSAKVDTVVSRLRSLKNEDGTPAYSIWQDKTDIVEGQDWWRAIVDAIIDCQVFVFMVSRESVISKNCLAELTYARKRNRHSLPFVIEGEIRYNATTGKNDLDYWEQLPTEITDNRAQFLFHESVSFVKKLEIACQEFTKKGFRDLEEPFPPDPRTLDETTAQQQSMTKPVTSQDAGS